MLSSLQLGEERGSVATDWKRQRTQDGRKSEKPPRERKNDAPADMSLVLAMQGKFAPMYAVSCVRSPYSCVYVCVCVCVCVCMCVCTHTHCVCFALFGSPTGSQVTPRQTLLLGSPNARSASQLPAISRRR